MIVKTYLPHPSLSTIIQSITTVDATLPSGKINSITPYPPTPFLSLIFYGAHPISMGRMDQSGFVRQACVVVVGPQLSRVNIMVHQRLRAIRVDFLPGGLFRLLGIPMFEILDEGIDATLLFGQGIGEVNNQIMDSFDLGFGKNLVEQYLMRNFKCQREYLPIDAAIKNMMLEAGRISIDSVAAMSCLSLKQFERKSKERLGMNPKMYARILKFSSAYRLHEARPQWTWTQIAYQSGYFDQMHMIRDFKAFAGVNPSIIERQLSGTAIKMQKDLKV